MTDREAFEAWAISGAHAWRNSRGVLVWPDNDGAMAECAWQAATAAEREECAKVCEQEIHSNPYTPVSAFDCGKYVMAEYLAAAIRERGTK
jgi:hypothetical protein